MNINIKLSGLIFIALFGLFGSINTAYARTIDTCTSAIFNASASSIRNNPTTVWFEWGKGTDEDADTYNRVTQTQTLTSNGDFSEMVSGLSPNTNYYYRAIVSNKDGVRVGDIITFKTSSCETENPQVPQRPIIVTPPPIINTVIRQNVTNTTGTTTSIKNTTDNDTDIPLSANALDTGSFFPATLFGWLILLVFVLALAALVKRTNSKLASQKHAQ